MISKFFSFKGKANRLDFFIITAVFALFFSLALSGINVSISEGKHTAPLDANGILVLITLLILIYLKFAVTVRRLRDVNLPILLILIPILMNAFLFSGLFPLFLVTGFLNIGLNLFLIFKPEADSKIKKTEE